MCGILPNNYAKNAKISGSKLNSVLFCHLRGKLVIGFLLLAFSNMPDTQKKTYHLYHHMQRMLRFPLLYYLLFGCGCYYLASSKCVYHSSTDSSHNRCLCTTETCSVLISPRSSHLPLGQLSLPLLRADEQGPPRTGSAGVCGGPACSWRAPCCRAPLHGSGMAAACLTLLPPSPCCLSPETV